MKRKHRPHEVAKRICELGGKRESAIAQVAEEFRISVPTAWRELRKAKKIATRGFEFLLELDETNPTMARGMFLWWGEHCRWRFILTNRPIPDEVWPSLECRFSEVLDEYDGACPLSQTSQFLIVET
jgi:hypothetical protein